MELLPEQNDLLQHYLHAPLGMVCDRTWSTQSLHSYYRLVLFEMMALGQHALGLPPTLYQYGQHIRAALARQCAPLLSRQEEVAKQLRHSVAALEAGTHTTKTCINQYKSSATAHHSATANNASSNNASPNNVNPNSTAPGAHTSTTVNIAPTLAVITVATTGSDNPKQEYSQNQGHGCDQGRIKGQIQGNISGQNRAKGQGSGNSQGSGDQGKIKLTNNMKEWSIATWEYWLGQTAVIAKQAKNDPVVKALKQPQPPELTLWLQEQETIAGTTLKKNWGLYAPTAQECWNELLLLARYLYALTSKQQAKRYRQHLQEQPSPNPQLHSLKQRGHELMPASAQLKPASTQLKPAAAQVMPAAAQLKQAQL